MPYAHKVLNAKHIEFPEYHQTYSIHMLGNFIDYKTKRMTRSAKFRLDCLCKDIDEHGMIHPILLYGNAYDVSVGHQRVWYAKQHGYTHIDCYHLPNQTVYEKVYTYTQSNDYWEKHT